MAVATAVFGGVVADSTGLEFAGSGIAAGIVATALLTTAIAVFAFLDDTVATLLASDGGDAAVVGEAVGFDAVAQEGRADVSDCAW